MKILLNWGLSIALFIISTILLKSQEENVVTLGSAVYDDSLNIFCITPDSSNVLGGGVYHIRDTLTGVNLSRPLDVNEGFYIQTEIFFGLKDSLGGEGFAIIFAKDFTDIQPIGTGGYLGYQHIPSSLAIVFDTHYQPEAPFFDKMEEDHMYLTADSILSDPVLSGPVSIRHARQYVNDLNVERADSTWFRVDIEWDPEEQLFEILVDGYIRISHHIDLINFLGVQNTGYIYAGIVGATSEGFSNEQKIRLLGSLAWYDADPRPILDCADVKELRNTIVLNHPDNGAWDTHTTLGKTYQEANGLPTMLAPPIVLIDAEMECKIKVKAGEDDNDYIGICWGLQQPFGQTNNDYKGWLLDWRKSPQVVCDTSNIEYAHEGLSLVYMDGEISTDCEDWDLAYFDHHNTAPKFQVIDSLWGEDRGWEVDTEYTFKVRYMTDTFDVWILHPNGDTLFESHHQGVFEPGRFAFYNYSQPNVEYSHFDFNWLPLFHADKDTICAGDPVQFSYASGNTLLPTIVDSIFWDFGNGDSLLIDSNTGIPSISYSFTEAGIYHVKLWVVAPSNCKSFYTQTVFVYPLPIVELGTDTTLCVGEVLYLTALNNTNGNIIWQDSIDYPTFIVDKPGYYHIYVDYNACSNRDTILVSFADTIQYQVEIRNSCFERNDGFIGVQLFSGNSVSAQLDDNFGWLHPELSPGIHQLKLTDSLGCIVEENILIEEACEPTFSLTTDSVSCYGGKDGRIMVQAEDCPLLFTLYDEQQLQNTVFDNLYAGEHLLYYIDSLGCAWDSIIVVDSPPPFEVLTRPSDTTIVIGQCINLNVLPSYGKATLVEWSPNTALNRTDTLEIIATPIEDQTYTVFMLNEKGCEAEGFINVIIDKDKSIYIPNIFSPNGDGVNDILFPQAENAAKAVDIINRFGIYDRWGNLIFLKRNFQPDDPSDGWDGKLAGKIIPNGVFIYTIEWTRKDGEECYQKGDVTIFR